jgi:hypothetical protein
MSFDAPHLKRWLIGLAAPIAVGMALLPGSAAAEEIAPHLVTPNAVAPHLVTPPPASVPAESPPEVSSPAAEETMAEEPPAPSPPADSTSAPPSVQAPDALSGKPVGEKCPGGPHCNPVFPPYEPKDSTKDPTIHIWVCAGWRYLISLVNERIERDRSAGVDPALWGPDLAQLNVSRDAFERSCITSVSE